MEKLIKITINTQGNPTIDAEGFSGDECIHATRSIEEALNSGSSENRIYKPEFVSSNKQAQTEEIRRM